MSQELQRMKARIFYLETQVRKIQEIMEGQNNVAFNVANNPQYSTCTRCNQSISDGYLCPQDDCCHGLNPE